MGRHDEVARRSEAGDGPIGAGGARVSVLGLGLMGAAFARALVDAGHSVTVWNRSPGRCAEFVARGARAASTPEDAVRSSDVSLLILSNYEVTADLMTQVGDAVSGRTLVNLSTGDPGSAVRLFDRMTSHGAAYLDGAIEAYPSEIGRPGTLISYSGSATAWSTYRELLLTLAGRSHFLGDDPGAANVLDAAMAGAFYNSALGAFHEAVSFATSSGIALADISFSIDYWIDLLRTHLYESVDEIGSGDYTTDQAALNTYLAAVRSWRTTVMAEGQRAHIMTANMHNLEAACEAGLGSLSLAAHHLTMK
ncbi:MAG: NAD(P)-dependent oxidoreductase, partial [Hyphomicrobiales bacterium]